ncbi:cytoplasmic incompatibility factor CifA [Wolbachia endosymbiont (group E) of Neria commutata]|uniref:cytoplasmic incompatibility factor CifA n=1 Tax=Wolbachia endosymbiont (group E) of Neria commutata TaxID=3066149 RepID=UPI0031331E16
MQIETKRHAAALKKLQGVIKHTDPGVAAGRKLAIKRWLETYIEHIKSFKDDKLGFLCNVFQDEGCWSGTRLNNTTLGQKLTEEKIGEIDNPLRRYEIACSYCVVDKILPFFQKRFESYKNSFSSGELDSSGNLITDKYIRNSLLSGIGRKGRVFNFWIDKESGELKQPNNAIEGFDSAVKFKWSEGVEYFYNQLEEKDKEKKLTEAIIALSRVQAIEEDAPILDFCIRNIADKDTLLQNLLQKDDGVYSLFNRLIGSCFFDTIHDLVKCWCYKGLSEQGDHSDQIFSQKEYTLLLSSLSKVMLKNPESSIQVRSIIMQIWECSRFNEHKKSAVDASSFHVPIDTVLAGLIVNWKRSGSNLDEKKEILDIMSFARDSFPEKFEFFKESIIEDLTLCGREGMKESIDYGDVAEKLFSELGILPGPVGDGPGYDLRTRSQAHGSRKTSLPLDGSGDVPQSKFESPDVSDASGSHKEKSIFTLSGFK